MQVELDGDTPPVTGHIAVGPRRLACLGQGHQLDAAARKKGRNIQDGD